MAVEPVVEGGKRKEPVQKEAYDGIDFICTKDKKDDEGEKEEGVVNSHEEHDAQNIANEEEKSENEEASGDDKESDIEDKTGKQANDSEKEENQSKEEEVSDSGGGDQEKVRKGEGGDDEGEEEEGNMSEESEGSMTIGNTVIAPSKEISEEIRAQDPRSLLTPFTEDEEVSSDEDDMPLSESRSVKKPKKKVLIVEPIVEVDKEDESDFALLAKSTTSKKRGAKVTKPATSSARAVRGKTRQNVPVVVDRLT
ncbi:uncharacterized protein [Nicotiana sylvestris]|uniref:uncharacterized protein n=1 Tax=Nicotiana sylvestris TaxID=4096 RepID=UPI00388C459F